MTMIEVIPVDGKDFAVVNADAPVIKDEKSAKDLMIMIKNNAKTPFFCINAEGVSNDFFDLDTGFAKKVLDMYKNYHMKFAVFGDITRFTNDNVPLQEFIEETNKGYDAFIVVDQEEAIKCLYKVSDEFSKDLSVE